MRTAIVSLALLISAGASASPANLILNGDFSQGTAVNGGGQGETLRGFSGASITDWTYNVPGGSGHNNGGLLTVLPSNNLNSNANIVDYGGAATYGLWNRANGGLATITAPPSGNPYVLAQDSAPDNAAYLSQTVNGLIVGKTYNVSFNFAGVQLRSADGSLWNGATNEGVTINLGGTYDIGKGTKSQSFTGGETKTAYFDNYNISIPQHGFTGWQSGVLSFTATAASEAFNLEGISTVDGAPPFVLIDNLRLTQATATPEPGTVALLGLGGLGLAAAVARRRK